MNAFKKYDPVTKSGISFTKLLAAIATPPQQHKYFRDHQWPPPSNNILPIHRHHQGLFLSYRREYRLLVWSKKWVVTVKIVRKWDRRIVGSGAYILWKECVPWHLGTQQNLDLNAVVILHNPHIKLIKCSDLVHGLNCIRPFLVLSGTAVPVFTGFQLYFL